MDAQSGIDLTHSPQSAVSFNATPCAPDIGADLHHFDASRDSCTKTDMVSTCLGTVLLNSNFNVDLLYICTQCLLTYLFIYLCNSLFIYC